MEWLLIYHILLIHCTCHMICSPSILFWAVPFVQTSMLERNLGVHQVIGPSFRSGFRTKSQQILTSKINTYQQQLLLGYVPWVVITSTHWTFPFQRGGCSAEVPEGAVRGQTYWSSRFLLGRGCHTLLGLTVSRGQSWSVCLWYAILIAEHAVWHRGGCFDIGFSVIPCRNR